MVNDRARIELQLLDFNLLTFLAVLHTFFIVGLSIKALYGIVGAETGNTQ